MGTIHANTNKNKKRGKRIMKQELIVYEWDDITPRDLVQLEREGYELIVSDGFVYGWRD